MAEINERITIRLDEAEIRLIDSYLSSDEQFRNRSELIRKAVGEYIAGRTSTGMKSSGRVTVDLPQQYMNTIQYLVSLGHFTSFNQGVIELVRDALGEIKEIVAKSKAIAEVNEEVLSEVGRERETYRRFMKK